MDMNEHDAVNGLAQGASAAVRLTVPDATRTEQGLLIKEKLIADGTVWRKDDLLNGKVWAHKGDRYKAQRPICGLGSVTIHNPGQGRAEVFVRATNNQNMHSSRVHYYVDDLEAWQMLREDEVAWHAGDGSKRGGGNATSLAIEICMGSQVPDQQKAEENGALLCALLLRRHGLPLIDGKTVRSHKSWTPKNHPKQCPIAILPHWAGFIARVEAAMKRLDGANAEQPVQPDHPVLRRSAGGQPSEAVRQLQRLLLAAGFDAKGIDGLFGPKTEAAVKAFQKARKLAQDGIVGRLTWWELRKAH